MGRTAARGARLSVRSAAAMVSKASTRLPPIRLVVSPRRLTISPAIIDGAAPSDTVYAGAERYPLRRQGRR